MHNTLRTRLLGAVLLASGVVMGTPLLADLVSRDQIREALLDTVSDAATDYRARQSTTAYQTLQQKIIDDGKAALDALGQKKRALRMQLSGLQKECSADEVQIDDVKHKKLQLENDAVEKREAMRDLLTHREVQSAMQNSGPEILRTMVMHASAETLRASTYQALHTDALAEVQWMLSKKAEQMAAGQDMAMIALGAAAGNCAARLETLTGQLAHAQQDYLEQVSKMDGAEHGVLLSQSELAQVKRDIAEIHRQVLRMQSTLARLDEQAKRKSERSLIELGIIDGKPNEYSPEKLLQQAKNMFRWPVSGRVAAGFHDSAYFHFFGIAHQGIDIVTPQGTPVGSAADGIVFVVRDGGATGYTYILLGHEGGFATLYGHLSQTLVEPGQQVKAGQVIGLSGATPGTPGAGPMTTGPHLHFEVIQGGNNIDPRSVLP